MIKNAFIFAYRISKENNLLKKTMNKKAKNMLAIAALGVLTMAGSIESPVYGGTLPPGG